MPAPVAFKYSYKSVFAILDTYLSPFYRKHMLFIDLDIADTVHRAPQCQCLAEVKMLQSMDGLSDLPSIVCPPKSSYPFLRHALSGMMFSTCPGCLGALDTSAPPGDPLSSHPAKAYGLTHRLRFQTESQRQNGM